MIPLFFPRGRFGTAGFCRSGNYGMPQLETNTMRVCTTDADGVQYDAAVPVKPVWPGKNEEAFSPNEYCAPSSSDVPWLLDDINLADPAMFSAGTVPMWSGDAWSTQSKYPSDSKLAELRNTNPGIRSASPLSWNQQSCDSSPSAAAGTAQLTCTTDADCKPLLPSQKMQCLSGVCILDRAATGTCYSHRDCLASKKWCSGNGICVDSVLQVENDLPQDPIEFELYAESCSSTDAAKLPTVQYDTYGASPWENIPDVLEMYGMCSYEDWYEYLEFIDPSDASRANAGICGGRSEARGCLPMASEATVSRQVLLQRFSFTDACL